MRLTPLENKIAEIASPVAQDLGLELVCVKITGEATNMTVTVMAEDNNGRLNVDDCAKLSRALSAEMDVEDPISGAYRLEVSSPGIDRPLVREKDFETYAGFEAKLESDTPLESGQKKFRGVLKGIENGDITIETDQGVAIVPLGTLKKAKLVLNDDLIKRTANK